MEDREDTIAAIATAPLPAAISIVRVSGKDALLITDKIFSKKVIFKSHRAYVGKILDEKNQEIDSVLLLVMLNPTSYTGEDLVEIHCHGGLLVTKKVFERVLSAGARVAQPGEFTLRAFLNKKMDLTQAEAVQQVIAAKNDAALFFAKAQLSGLFSTKITSLQEKLVEIAAILEAWIDFPEEGLEFATQDEIIKRTVEYFRG